MTNYSVPTLRKYAYLGNFGNSVQELADMARPERWNTRYAEKHHLRKLRLPYVQSSPGAARS